MPSHTASPSAPSAASGPGHSAGPNGPSGESPREGTGGSAREGIGEGAGEGAGEGLPGEPAVRSREKPGGGFGAELGGPVIGLDVGGTGARGLLATADGAPLGRASSDSPGGFTDVVRELMGMADEAPIAAVVLGTTGLSVFGADGFGPGGRAGLAAVLAEVSGAATALVVSDVLTSYAGALGLTGGAVIAAGTGAVALGTDLRGVWRRVDGWGHLLGDCGGGAWIGRAALDAALRRHDGRPGGSAALLAALKERFGSPERLIDEIYTRTDRSGLMARFVPAVVAAATAGDPIAAAILTEAGEHLADTALAALPPGAPRVVAPAGNLIPSVPALAEPLRAKLTEAGIDVRPPLGTSVEGAVRLARTALTGSLPPGLAASGLLIAGG
jgi:N-acetylglucosamine kinase-like BadF-type ATPase